MPAGYFYMETWIFSPLYLDGRDKIREILVYIRGKIYYTKNNYRPYPGVKKEVWR